MASFNALIGVAVASYFPDLTLSGQYGTSGAGLGNLFTAATSLWSVGAELTGTLLDFGARKAQVRGAKAAYDESVATYRQTVLTAFHGGRTNCRPCTPIRRRKRCGSTSISIRKVRWITPPSSPLQERLQASVLLVEDLGGGWSRQDLPKG